MDIGVAFLIGLSPGGLPFMAIHGRLLAGSLANQVGMTILGYTAEPHRRLARLTRAMIRGDKISFIDKAMIHQADDKYSPAKPLLLKTAEIPAGY